VTLSSLEELQLHADYYGSAEEVVFREAEKMQELHRKNNTGDIFLGYGTPGKEFGGVIDNDVVAPFSYTIPYNSWDPFYSVAKHNLHSAGFPTSVRDLEELSVILKR
jgi:hypothetical protein